MKTLAERLRYAMEVLPPKRIKGVELADAVGVKPPSVSDWLSGKSKTMEGENLLRAAKHLKVSPVWLATGNGDPKQSPSASNAKLEVSQLLVDRSENLIKLINILDELEDCGKLDKTTFEVLFSILKIIKNTKK